MQRFFSSIEAIDQFTQSLDGHSDSLQCHQCRASGQLVSHGFVFKQRSRRLSERVGKRVLCSNRYGRSGCGRTFQLYLDSEVPCLQYGAAQLTAFIVAILANLSVVRAYQCAVGCTETRHGWRWINRLMGRLMEYRCAVKTAILPALPTISSRCRRLQLLLPTLAALPTSAVRCPCSDFQHNTQSRFI